MPRSEQWRPGSDVEAEITEPRLQFEHAKLLGGSSNAFREGMQVVGNAERM